MVDDRHEPGRIEIELTSHDPGPRVPGRVPGRVPRRVPGRRPAVEPARGPDGAAGAAPTPEEPVGPGVLGTERGRLVASGVAVAAVALIVGVLVGRLGSGGVETTDDPSPTSSDATSTSSPPGNRDSLPRAPSVLAPTTTRPTTTRAERATTTTVDPERMSEGSVSLGAAVRPEKIEVIAVTRQGVVVRIDAITGATVSTQTGSPFGPTFVAAGDGWVLVPDDRGGATLIADDGSRSSVDLGGWWPPLTDGGAAFWRAEFDQSSGQLSRLVETSLDGSATGEVIGLDGYYPQLVDPLGGVVVQAPGGYYVVTPDSRTRITEGQLHALGRRRALVSECDERLECGFFAIDRASGVRERVEIAPELATQFRSGGIGWWGFGAPLSPDETALVVATFDDAGPSIGVLDLQTGSYTRLGVFENEPQAAWSPGSRYLYWIEGGRIMVFDRSNEESVPFSDDLDPVTALTVRAFVGPADVPG